MPYELRGNKVVKSSTGEVVKDHGSDHAKAVRHLRALKANVEEAAPGLLGSLLEGFEEARHPRDFRGRFKAGDHVMFSHMLGKVPARVTKVTAGRVHVTSSDSRVSDTSMTHNQAAVKLEHVRSAPSSAPANPFALNYDAIDAAAKQGDSHGGFKIGDVVTHETGSRGAGGHGPVTFTKQPGMSTVVGLQRNGNLRLKEPVHGTTHDVHHSHAQKVSPLHPDYRGKVVQDAYAAQRAETERQKRARAGKVSEAHVLGELLEGFAAPATNPFEGHAFDAGDQVRVSVGGGAKAVTGRVVRPHGGPPATHAVIAPEGGGAHVLAPVGQVKLNTPAQHAAVARRREQQEAKQASDQATSEWMARKPPGVKLPGAAGKVREGVGLMLQAFTPPPTTPGETPAQSNAIARKQVAAANQSLSSGWNASKHPRAQGGKFGYTTGGKRATRSPAAKSRTLGHGSSGALVKAVQRQLHISADGKYGNQTRAAVSRYQSQHRLQVDGVVGRQTLAALRGDPNARKIKPGPITSRAATVKHHPAARAKRPAKPPAPTRYGGGIVV